MKDEMKQFFFFAVLLVVLGIAGFFYRATLQAPTRNTNMASSTAVACQADAKICPDGTSVSRSGPSCTFAACPFPNVELPSASISYVAPSGFAENKQALGADATLLAAYEKSPTGTSTLPATRDSIVVRRYAIPAGKDANAVMLAQTMYESSGNQPKTMNEFTPVIINGKTYQTIVVERFEAQVHVLYYLPRENDVLRFEAIQHNVENWTDSKLSIRSLATVAALETMLTTLTSNTVQP
jgi:hypothetical protein